MNRKTEKESKKGKKSNKPSRTEKRTLSIYLIKFINYIFREILTENVESFHFHVEGIEMAFPSESSILDFPPSLLPFDLRNKQTFIPPPLKHLFEEECQCPKPKQDEKEEKKRNFGEVQVAKTRKKPSSRSSTWGKKGGESDRSKTPKAVAPCVRTG